MSTRTEEHNGWTNFETWATYSWLTNTEGLLDEAQKTIRDAEAGEGYRRLRAGVGYKFELEEAMNLQRGDNALAEWFEFDVLVSDEGSLDDLQQRDNMQRDIGSLWRVDWKAIADALREEEAG
jgi:hypothetical protein